MSKTTKLKVKDAIFKRQQRNQLICWETMGKLSE